MFLASVATLLLGAISCVSAAPAKFDAGRNLFQLTPKGSGFRDGYYYSFWKDFDHAKYYSGPDGSFNITWGTGGNVVAGVGRNPGNQSPISYSGDWDIQGNAYLSVYGWFQDPNLVEYYIVENFGSFNPSHGAKKLGEVKADGSIYDLYLNKRVNAPSIKGTRTFYQYWSVRRDKRSSGTVTTKKHFNAWKSHNLKIGPFDYQIVAVEGYFSTGKAAMTVN